MLKKFANSSDVESAQRLAQVEALRRVDRLVVDVVLTSSHAALYVLENGASVHWRKVGIEGFFYLLKRSESPIYQILLLNQTDSGEGDFTQSLDDKIRFEVKEGTFFYQVGESENVRGLWFHDREFMLRFIRTIELIYAEQNLTCDGTYDRQTEQEKSRQDPSSTSGRAILKMLRKESSPVPELYREEVRPEVSCGSPDRTIVALLRKEFTTPADIRTELKRIPPPPPPPYGSVDTERVNQPRDLMTPSAPDSITIPRKSLRNILREILSSDEFVDNLCAGIESRLNLI